MMGIYRNELQELLDSKHQIKVLKTQEKTRKQSKKTRRPSHPCKVLMQHQTITSIIFLETRCPNRLMSLR